MKKAQVKPIDLVALDTQLNRDWREALKQASIKGIPVYIVLKHATTAYLDRIIPDALFDEETQQYIEWPHRIENVTSHSFLPGDVFTVPNDQLDQAWLKNPIFLEKIIPTPNLPLSLGRIKPSGEQFDHTDLLIHRSDVDKLKPDNTTETKRSGRRPDSYTQAIELALETDIDASSEEVFDWIKAKTDDFTHSAETCFNDIECVGDELAPFPTAKADDFVLKDGNKTVSKATFRQNCSRIRKKLKNKKN